MGRKNTRRTLSAMLVIAILSMSLVFAAVAIAKPARNVATAAVSTSTVVVSVKSVTGRMVDGAKVEVYSGQTKFTGVTGMDGKVTISGVPYGTYYVGISHRLFCDSYYQLVVDEANEAFCATAHPKSLWEGIGY